MGNSQKTNQMWLRNQQKTKCAKDRRATKCRKDPCWGDGRNANGNAVKMENEVMGMRQTEEQRL